MEMCSCKQFCPCWLGPEGEPDQGWCSGVFAFDVRQGSSEGVDLGGTRTALLVSWPGNFFAGQGTARLYLDAANDEQRRELEGIFGGTKEGFLSGLWGAVIDEWLPVQSAKVELGWDESPTIAVNGMGQAALQPLTNGAGQPTTISGAMAQGAMHIDSMQLAGIKESQFSDPGMRGWQAEDGVLFDFDWSS
jgi:hypothetical protein